VEFLDSALPDRHLPLSLASVGFRVGDVVTSGSRHRQIVEAP
jgi:hypothetical protein